MDYLTIKTLHHAAVALSATGFIARGAGMLMGATWVRQKPARVLPHIVDTALLATGITLAVMLRLDPMQTSWLGAKLLGLLGYIGLGMVALRPGRPQAERAVAQARRRTRGLRARQAAEGTALSWQEKITGRGRRGRHPDWRPRRGRPRGPGRAGGRRS